MDSQITDLAAKVLQKEKEFIVPVKRIWLTLSLMGVLDEIEFESFSIMLREDERFEIFDNQDNDLLEDHINGLEEIGFFMGPRVMLRSRRPTRKELGDLLIRKTNLVFENLKSAWSVRDKYDEKEEDQLLYALANTQKLLRALKREFPEYKKDEQFITKQ